MENRFVEAFNAVLCKRLGPTEGDEVCTTCHPEEEGGCETNSNELRLATRLKVHDWHYQRSDDHSVFLEGKRSYERMMGLVVKIPIERAREIWEEHAPDIPFPESRRELAKPPSDAFDANSKTALARAQQIADLLQQEVNAGKLRGRIGLIQWGDVRAMKRISRDLAEVLRRLGENPES